MRIRGVLSGGSSVTIGLWCRLQMASVVESNVVNVSDCNVRWVSGGCLGLLG